MFESQTYADFLQIKAGKFVAKTESFELVKTVNNYIDLLKTQVNDKDIQVKVIFDSENPKMIRGDK